MTISYSLAVKELYLTVSTGVDCGGFFVRSRWFSWQSWDMRLVSACSYLTPLLSTLVAAAYLRVTPPLGLWLGCAALVAGSLASWWAVEHRAV